MRRTGTIYLYDKDKIIVASKRYDAPEDRRKTIRYWTSIYAAGMKKSYIQIAPDANSLLHHPDGLNIKREDRVK